MEEQNKAVNINYLLETVKENIKKKDQEWSYNSAFEK